MIKHRNKETLALIACVVKEDGVGLLIQRSRVQTSVSVVQKVLDWGEGGTKISVRR